MIIQMIMMMKKNVNDDDDDDDDDNVDLNNDTNIYKMHKLNNKKFSIN